MRKSKAIISAVIIAAIAIFVVAAVSTVMTGSSENYQRPSSPTLLSDNDDQSADTTTEEESDSLTEQAQQALDDEKKALESATEEAVDATGEVVDSATESAVGTSESLTEKTNEAIAAAEQSAAEGREEAEALLAEVSEEAEKVVSSEKSAEPASAETHTVTAQGLVYNPLVVKIAPGDTVSWTNMSTHDTQSIEGLIPEGAEAWHSAMSENYRRTFTQEGIYIYKCTPHFGAGMGGAIIVGEPVNLDQIKAADAKGAAKRLVTKALQAVESM